MNSILSDSQQSLAQTGPLSPATSAPIHFQPSLMEKLTILSDAAKYDVACTSSGVNRKGNGVGMGNSIAPGICHTFSADGRCVSLLKILFSNECIFNCAYCQNNRNHDIRRATFTPDEICTLTMEFYRRNYIEGLFLSSGIVESPNHTMELLYESLYKLRNIHHFNGYIHVKAIPGADPILIQKTGFLADRMSINMELPTAQSLKDLAPCKTRNTILKPMRQIQNGIHAYRQDLLLSDTGSESAASNLSALSQNMEHSFTHTSSGAALVTPSGRSSHSLGLYEKNRHFVPAGQSTQMIIGATPESDYQIMSVAENLYDKFQLKRVFYSAFVNVTEDSRLPALAGGPPLLREHRLYQADWLLRFYGFSVSELLSEDRPDFNIFLDPKCDWALRHLEYFPVEIQQANYATLMRVPGIGAKSARRIIQTRRHARLDFNDLKRMGVVLKRALYFITCSGRMMYHTKLEEDYICQNLLHDKTQIPRDLRENSYRQLSLFDADVLTDFHMSPNDLLTCDHITI